MYHYKLFSYFGLILGTLLVAFLGSHLDVSLLVVLSLAFFSVLTFIFLTLVIKVLIGRERLVYYYYQISVLLLAFVLLFLSGSPILVYLDILVLGLGACLACFRVGCLTVGCCHGRPFNFGICYGEKHAKAGFTSYYTGLKLFPIQAVELLWVIGIVLVGINLLLKNPSPGSVFAWYIVAYAAGRFYFEFLRGDPGRLFFLEFSEAQWISLFSMLFIIIAGYSGILVSHWWYSGLFLCLATTMIFVSIVSHFQINRAYQLLNANHVKEIAEALKISSSFSSQKSAISSVNLKCTSRGIRISSNKLKTNKRLVQQYTFSSSKEIMTKPVALTLANLTLKLTDKYSSSELLERQRGVFHLLIFFDGAE